MQIYKDVIAEKLKICCRMTPRRSCLQEFAAVVTIATCLSTFFSVEAGVW